MNPPVLTYPDFSKHFILHVDAPKDRLRCALWPAERVGYSSRTLAGSEKCYHSSKLEYLALKWVASDHFKTYLYHSKRCNVLTNDNSLLHAISTAKLNKIVNIRQMSYEITPSHIIKQGMQNKVADCLSRSPIEVKVET